jgi:aminopeptidase N
LRKLLLWVFFGSICLSAQRLPRTAIPEHYSLWLNPDLKTGTLTGRAEIRLQLLKSTRAIWLNAVGLKATSVRITARDREIAGIAVVDEAQEMLEVTFPEELPAGDAVLKIEYFGRIRDDLKGLYFSKTQRRSYAVTQFEGTYARMMFPSFDEPEYKATFDISVVTDEGDTAISNGAIANEQRGPEAGKHTITFATSPKMSTYLVALAIGDFRCASGSADNIPIRICALPEKEKLTTFALGAAESFMKFYNQYYSIKYPFKKLDMVAIPDYEWGGMENTASIFYKERALLVDAATATVDAKRGVASVVAHEMAHQWFGDLVTTKWWDDIWLNEGFATWMTPKALAAWDPSWDQKPEIAQTKAFVMRVDARSSTRPIHGKGETPAEIKELFDGVAYQKGASVLHMMEHYLGEAAFRKGVNAYLERYANGNATSENFWAELEKASGKPVSPIMQNYVLTAGVPLVSLTCKGSSCDLHQERYGKNESRSSSWTIPVCMRSLQSTTNTCELLSKGSQTFRAPASTFLLNASGTGYYRTAYPAVQLAAIRKQWESVTPAERMTVLDDAWALVRINRTPISEFLSLAEVLQQEKNRPVIELMLPRLQEVERLLGKSEDRTTFERWQSAQLAPIASTVGFAPRPDDTDDVKALRASLFDALARLGDEQAKKVAAETAEKYLSDPASVDASLGNEALHAAAANGDAALYDQLEKKLESAGSPQLYFQYLLALTAFREPALIDRSLAMLISPKMREQDVGSFLSGLLRNPDARDRAWKFLQNHFSELQGKIVSFGGSGSISALGAYCSDEKAKEVREFFDNHPLPGAERAIKGSLEEIRNCSAVRQAQGATLEKWLAQHARASSSVNAQ